MIRRSLPHEGGGATSGKNKLVFEYGNLLACVLPLPGIRAILIVFSPFFLEKSLFVPTSEVQNTSNLFTPNGIVLIHQNTSLE